MITFHSITREGRKYTAIDSEEAKQFALKFGGHFIPDLEQAKKGHFVVLICQEK